MDLISTNKPSLGSVILKRVSFMLRKQCKISASTQMSNANDKPKMSMQLLFKQKSKFNFSSPYLVSA